MNLFFIERYIKKITKEDIYNYALSQEITLSSKELDILYHYLKNYYKEFLLNKESQPIILKEIQSQITPKTANKLEELYQLYKNKI